MATAATLLSIAHQTRFALCLAAAFSSPSSPALPVSNTNAVFSPLSLHVALSLLAAGSGGATRDQLLAALGGGHGPDAVDSLHALADQVARIVMADGSEAGGPRIAFADAVFADASWKLKPAFQELAVGKYKAHTHSVDFQKQAAEVAGQVNTWVEKVTSGTIEELLPPGSVDESTRLVLGNALYFKGAWTNKFDASETRDGEFHLLNGSSVEAPFMSSRDDQYMASYGDLKVLRLPYEQGGDKRQFSMYILLPEAQDGLWSLAQKLSSEPEFLDRHIPTRKIPVGQIKVPKFKISFGFEASELLKGLGLQLPFSPEADLSEFVDSPVPLKLSVSSILHKSFVEVNEEGTEAAAASAIVTRGTSLRRIHPDYFIADHPFLFLIREDTTGVVLFVGHVVNPLLA
ncbi:serpin-ZXA-like [Miscanthus floridulus]|uniref:serpin-ZXA-like n=1 Tax=Miscanthus floridulus TaxID=154761 RepID=UPI00345A2BF9